MKIYLGGPMFTAADVAHNLRMAEKLRQLGFEVYCPNENQSINDKTRTDLKGENVYLADLAELESSNIFLCNVAEDSGTMWEAGFMDCLSKRVDSSRYLGCIGLATDIRLQTPPNPSQPGVDNQTFYLNQFIVGGLKLSLGIFLTEDEVFDKLRKIHERSV